jgi:hypothetical protein
MVNGHTNKEASRSLGDIISFLVAFLTIQHCNLTLFNRHVSNPY